MYPPISARTFGFVLLLQIFSNLARLLLLHDNLGTLLLTLTYPSDFHILLHNLELPYRRKKDPRYKYDLTPDAGAEPQYLQYYFPLYIQKNQFSYFDRTLYD